MNAQSGFNSDMAEILESSIWFQYVLVVLEPVSNLFYNIWEFIIFIIAA